MSTYWMRPTKLRLAGLALLVMSAINAVVSIHNGMKACADGCHGHTMHTTHALHDFLVGNGTAIDPPFFLIGLFIIGLLVNLRRDRWGLSGTVLVGLVAGFQPFGELSEPLVRSSTGVFSSAHFDFGIALPIALYLLAALAVFVTAVWELVVRMRNSGRLPTPHLGDLASSPSG